MTSVQQEYQKVYTELEKRARPVDATLLMVQVMRNWNMRLLHCKGQVNKMVSKLRDL